MISADYLFWPVKYFRCPLIAFMYASIAEKLH